MDLYKIIVVMYDDCLVVSVVEEVDDLACDKDGKPLV